MLLEKRSFCPGWSKEFGMRCCKVLRSLKCKVSSGSYVWDLVSCVQTPASPFRHYREIWGFWGGGWVETVNKWCRVMLCSPALSCPREARRSCGAAASWLGHSPWDCEIFGMDVPFCECFHQGESDIAQTLVALGSEELVELASLDPLQWHFQSSPTEQTPSYVQSKFLHAWIICMHKYKSAFPNKALSIRVPHLLVQGNA